MLIQPVTGAAILDGPRAGSSGARRSSARTAPHPANVDGALRHPQQCGVQDDGRIVRESTDADPGARDAVPADGRPRTSRAQRPTGAIFARLAGDGQRPEVGARRHADRANGGHARVDTLGPMYFPDSEMPMMLRESLQNDHQRLLHIVGDRTIESFLQAVGTHARSPQPANARSARRGHSARGWIGRASRAKPHRLADRR